VYTEKNIGKIGDVIHFKRNNLFVIGQIISLREVTCVVEISQAYADELKLETTRTVVRHGKYKIFDMKEKGNRPSYDYMPETNAILLT